MRGEWKWYRGLSTAFPFGKAVFSIPAHGAQKER